MPYLRLVKETLKIKECVVNNNLNIPLFYTEIQKFATYI